MVLVLDAVVVLFLVETAVSCLLAVSIMGATVKQEESRSSWWYSKAWFSLRHKEGVAEGLQFKYGETGEKCEIPPLLEESILGLRVLDRLSIVSIINAQATSKAFINAIKIMNLKSGQCDLVD